MTRLPRRIIATALAGFALAACGPRPVGGNEPGPVANDCGTLACSAPLQLDADRCTCTCGAEGVSCREHELCVPDPGGGAACRSTRCSGVACERGMTCDPIDGRCTCGEHGPTCGVDERCNDGRCVPPDLCAGAACGERGACDPADGICRCGGAVCAADEICTGGRCGPDPCAGVPCRPGAVCSRMDALCHCGAADGPVCADSQICVEDYCVPDEICFGLTCPPNQVCDPDRDTGGFCRCGGIGPSFPRCLDTQVCWLDDVHEPRCIAEACLHDDCDRSVRRSSCDPVDGLCKCGGEGGVPCGGDGASGPACAAWQDRNVCTTTCHPLAPTCTAGNACAYDATAAIAVCLPEGKTPSDQPCKASSDCVPGAFCAVGIDDRKVCRELCNLVAGQNGEPSGCPDSRQCLRLPNAPDGLGQCL